VTELIRKPLAWVVGVILLGLAAWWLVAAVTGGKRAATEARLGKEQTGAAIGSGKDAVKTVGQRQASDAAIDKKVNDAKSDVAAATDAPGADAAGRRGLCGVSADLCGKHPVQQPRPR
jgi:hypothetical protein